MAVERELTLSNGEKNFEYTIERLGIRSEAEVFLDGSITKEAEPSTLIVFETSDPLEIRGYRLSLITGLGESAGDLAEVVAIDGDNSRTLEARITEDGTLDIRVFVNTLAHPSNLTITVTKVRPQTTWIGYRHLAGRKVAVIADGNIIANPNNPAYEQEIIVNDRGYITLPTPATKVTVGIPFVSDIKTLNIDSVDSLTNKAIMVKQATLSLEKTRGIFVGEEEPTGDNLVEDLQELKHLVPDTYDQLQKDFTGRITQQIETRYGNGSILVRQVDPLPMTILSITPNFSLEREG